MIVFDTYAWVEYFSGSKKGKQVEQYLEEGWIVTPKIVLVELSIKSIKENWDFQEIFSYIKTKSEIVDIGDVILPIIGNTYFKVRQKFPNFGVIDAIVLSIAQNKGAKLLTGDAHFVKFSETIFLK